VVHTNTVCWKIAVGNPKACGVVRVAVGNPKACGVVGVAVGNPKACGVVRDSALCSDI
jgi:hypothetical protein